MTAKILNKVSPQQNITFILKKTGYVYFNYKEEIAEISLVKLREISRYFETFFCDKTVNTQYTLAKIPSEFSPALFMDFVQAYASESEMKISQIEDVLNIAKLAHFYEINQTLKNKPKPEMQNEILNLMREKKVPGLSLVIIENGEIALHLDLGVKDSKTHELIDSDTVYEAASLSKPLFTYGVLKLVEEGQLDLDKPLVEYLSYNDLQEDKKLNFITARMVLAHTTGLPNWRPKNEALEIYFQPGERFSYSGEGFVYLQKVIEHLSGSSLEEYIKKTVFIPLEMNHSTFIWVNTDKKASGHSSEGLPFESYIGIPPNAAFTLHTTVSDYAKFVIAFMKGVGLKSETFDEMLRPQTRVPEKGINSVDKSSDCLSSSISWGLGWGLQKTALANSFWHWGDNHGFKSFVIGYKNQRKAVIAFTNGSNGLSAISELVHKYTGISQPAFDWI